MAGNSEVNRLRDLARKRHRAATQKISRAKKQTGAELSGSKFDPRKELGSLKRMNSIQLKAHIARLETFVSRETQFVAGKNNIPLPASKFQKVKELEKQYNETGKKNLSQIENVFLDSAGMTVGERVAATLPKHPTMAPPASHAPHLPYNRSSKGIPNEKALDKLIKDMKAKTKPGYVRKKLNQQWDAAEKMVEGIRNSKLADEFATLTDKEFNMLWNYTNFAEVSSLDYLIRKSMLHDDEELAWYDVALDTQLREARKRIGEIKALKLGGRLRNNNRRK